jgi:hypothetical protein
MDSPFTWLEKINCDVAVAKIGQVEAIGETSMDLTLAHRR